VNKRHKWAEVIIAWAEGLPIQMKLISDGIVWVDYNSTTHLPNFDNPNIIWRIKPEPMDIYYWVALFYDVRFNRYYTLATNSADTANDLETNQDFVKWIHEQAVFTFER